MKTGLVLEGGAMRGLFTAGITDVMMEHSLFPDGIIGVSAGAAFGCNLKSGQIGRSIRYNLRFARDPRYCSILSLLLTGNLYGAEFCYHRLPEKLDVFDTDAFMKSPIEFYVTCTDVLSGKPVYHRIERADYDDLEWMRASASMPLVSRIVKTGGYQMLDGGISDSIPLRYFQSIGFDRNIVILTQPRGYTKSKNGLLSVMRAVYRKYPNLLDAIEHRHEHYNETLEYLAGEEQRGNILLLCPDEKLPIDRVDHNPDNLRAVYDIGRACGEKHIEKIRNFLHP
ncbi:MAG: patatin family protein [Clostridia bacterium]|nr:patatin family protein [Clostridia bacterium]